MARAVMLMWPLAAAASSLRALSTSVPFYEVLVSPSFTGSDHLLSPVYLGLLIRGPQDPKDNSFKRDARGKSDVGVFQ